MPITRTDFSFSPFNMMLTVGLSYVAFIMLRCGPSVPTLLTVLSLIDVEFCQKFFLHPTVIPFLSFWLWKIFLLVFSHSHQLLLSESESHLSYMTLYDPMDCGSLGSSVHGILQARTLGWVGIPFSWASSWPRVWTQVSCLADRFFTIWVTREYL